MSSKSKKEISSLVKKIQKILSENTRDYSELVKEIKKKVRIAYSLLIIIT
jgi:hypothetical protein